MSPQVADWGKALLLFNNGFPINNYEDAEWLAIHGANLFGNDKVSFTDRIQWAWDNEDDIVRCAENPLDYMWWTTADKPWQFLSWCFEWYGLLGTTLTYLVLLMVAVMDCNTYQLSFKTRRVAGLRTLYLVTYPLTSTQM